MAMGDPAIYDWSEKGNLARHMTEPLVRINGQLAPLKVPPLTPEMVTNMLAPVIPERLRGQLERDMAEN